MTSRPVVFLGPTLARGEASSLLDADIRPPARLGDVYAALGAPVAALVVIDGVFHGEPSVWHRELLCALDAGVPVIGAASMGALRAAELAPFGMIGVGTVFAWYRDGVLDADDAVALWHGSAEAGFVPLSEPLVTWRASADAAVAAGAIPADDAATLLACVGRRPYPERRADIVHGDLVDLGWTPSRARRALAALRAHRVDIKAADARAALCAARTVGGAAPRAAEWPPPRWRRVRVLHTPWGDTDPTAWVASLAADPERRRRAAVEAIALAWAERLGLLPGVEPDGADGIWPRDLAARARAERAALAAVAACEGSVDGAARAWCAAHGVPPCLDDPAGLGLPWEEDAALVEAWWREVVP